MKPREETATASGSRLSIQGRRRLGLTAIVLTASALIAPVQASGESRSATSRGTSTTRIDRATNRGIAPRSDIATANGRRVFGGSVAPTVRAAAFVPAATAPAATGRPPSPRTDRSAGAPSPRDAVGAAPLGAEQSATDDVWSAVTPERAPSVMPIAGDGAAVSGSTTGSNLPLGLLLLGAGVLSLLCGLVAAMAHGRIRVG